MSVRFLILEQTITYLQRWCPSELQIFIIVFQKKKWRIVGEFLFGMKICGLKLSSQWLNLEQIWPADIWPCSYRRWQIYQSINNFSTILEKKLPWHETQEIWKSDYQFREICVPIYKSAEVHLFSVSAPVYSYNINKIQIWH